MVLACAPLWAEEGMPHWRQLVDQMLERVEAAAAMPAPVAGLAERFSQPAHDATAAVRLNGFRPLFEPVFRQEGVPAEMIWMGLVESGYNRWARSAKNALGVWPLTPEAARYLRFQAPFSLSP